MARALSNESKLPPTLGQLAAFIEHPAFCTSRRFAGSA